VWILAVWILGEMAATHFGYSLTPKTGLGALVRERGQLETEAEGVVVDIQENDYGLSLVLDDAFVRLPDSVRFSSEDKIIPERSDMESEADPASSVGIGLDVTYAQAAKGNRNKPAAQASDEDRGNSGYIKTGCRIRVTGEYQTLNLGNRVLVEGKLSEIEEASNPGQFDRRSWYESRGIGFQMKASGVSVVDDREYLLLPDLSEGMENALREAARTSGSRRELIAALAGKRYPAARISRLCACVLLGVTKEQTESVPLPENALLLGLRTNSAMTAFWKSLPFPVISSFTEWKKAAHPADLAAWRLWAQCCRLPDTLPFSEKIVSI
jgi:hypothetical protein